MATDMIARAMAAEAGSTESVKNALTDTTAPEWTPADQLAARQRLGLDKEWTLVGTIAGYAENRGNIDTGVDVDLTGCTELYIEARGIGTNNVIFRGVIGGLPINMAIPIVTNSERVASVLYQDSDFGTFGIVGKSSAVGSQALGGSVSIFNLINLHIKDITAFNLDNPALITNCDIKIYAR